MSLAMTTEEREAFLTGMHVGVIGIERADGPPLTVPIWYGYERPEVLDAPRALVHGRLRQVHLRDS